MKKIINHFNLYHIDLSSGVNIRLDNSVSLDELFPLIKINYINYRHILKT